jgi:hypothetical protein
MNTTNTQNMILHALSSVNGASLTSLEIAEILDESIVDVNRALNNEMKSELPKIELDNESGDGYRFIVSDNKSDNSGDLVNDSDHDLLAESISLVAGVFGTGKKMIIDEATAIKKLGLNKADFELALTSLNKMGGIQILEMEDYEERVFKKTDTTDDYLNYSAPVIEKEAAVKTEVVNKKVLEKENIQNKVEFDDNDEIKIIARPVRNVSRRSTATDDVNPVLDEMILSYIKNEGVVSETGPGRHISGFIEGHGKVGRPRVGKRIIALYESGQLVKFTDDKGNDKFKIPGTTGKKVVAKKAKAVKTNETKSDDVKTDIIKDDNPLGVQVSEKPKAKRGRPAKVKVDTDTSANVVNSENIDVDTSTKVDIKPDENIAVVTDESVSPVEQIRAMLGDISNGNPEALISAFGAILEHIDNQDKELAQWRTFGKGLVEQVSKI